MANLRACCCGYPETPCTGTCDFDTSYAVSNLQVVLNYVSQRKNGSCSACSNYDGANVQTDVSWTVTGTQSTPCTLVRYGQDGCCYRGGGQMGFSYNLQKPETYFCCGFEPFPVCTRDVPHIGTSGGVPFCYSVVCQRGGAGTPFPNETSVWYHELFICNFPLERAAFAELDEEECYTYDCNSVSLGRAFMMSRGAHFVWYSRFKPLDQLLPGDVSPARCLNIIGCQYDDPNQTCYPDPRAYSGGPFSIYLIDESITDAEPCTNYDGGNWLDTSACCAPINSSPGLFECLGGQEADCYGNLCCYTTYLCAINFPTIF